MPSVTATQQRNPGAFPYQPDRHYLKVQGDSLNYEGKVERYLDEASPMDPSKDKYRLESEDRKVTGDKAMKLLSCSVEDHAEEQRLLLEDSKGLAKVTGDGEKIHASEPVYIQDGVLKPNI